MNDMESAMRGDLVDRLRGRYPIGPTLPDGEPYMGYRQFDVKLIPPINFEAAEEIETLRAERKSISDEYALMKLAYMNYEQQIECQRLIIKELKKQNAVLECYKNWSQPK